MKETIEFIGECLRLPDSVLAGTDDGFHVRLKVSVSVTEDILIIILNAQLFKQCFRCLVLLQLVLYLSSRETLACLLEWLPFYIGS